MIFITKIENGESTNEGLCLKCAKELNIKPVEDIIRKMGLTDEDLDSLTDEMMEAMGGVESLTETENTEEEGKTATFPFLNRLFGGSEESPSQPEFPRPGREPKDKEPGGQGGKKRKYLESYCISLTQRARDGKLDRMVGRAVETERVIQILNRRQKNNPCLIGEPGVGKTAIAEGLAQRIADGKVPYKLRDKEVYLMDLTALVAGTQFRGQFESRMKGLIEEIKAQQNIILVIDEVHNLVGAGDAEGSMNAANILKPALSRGEIQVIGATTFTEYRKHIEKDSALERRFQPVTVNEPSIGETIEIIRGIKHYYENFHGVKITDEIARQAVLLSERYITDRFLPDKAIDLIDEACSDMNLKSEKIARMDLVRKEKADLQKERELLLSSAISGDDYAPSGRHPQPRHPGVRRAEPPGEGGRAGAHSRQSRPGHRALDEDPRLQHPRGRVQAPLRARQAPEDAYRRAGRGGGHRLRRHPAKPRRHLLQAQAGVLHLHRLHGRRQDRAGQAAGRGSFRFTRGAHPPRHVRVHGKSTPSRVSSAHRRATSGTTRPAS